MKLIEVFADVTCPFAHVGLRRFVGERDRRRRSDVALRVRAWPLELVNGRAEDPADLASKIDALRDSVAPDLFHGFDPERFSPTSLPALALEAKAYAVSTSIGERVSLSLRGALFEDGLDISDPHVLSSVAPDVTTDASDEQRVLLDWEAGKTRKVIGSPHFFVDDQDFFCPSLSIERNGGTIDVQFDAQGFATFLEKCLS